MRPHFLISPGKKNCIGMVDSNLCILKPPNRYWHTTKWQKISSPSSFACRVTVSIEECFLMRMEHLSCRRIEFYVRWHSLPELLLLLSQNMIDTNVARLPLQLPSLTAIIYIKPSVPFVIRSPCLRIIAIAILVCQLTLA